ncbi:MAG: diguanylate cyclase domain-containing protein [Burkholderiaceae bacterium]
MSTTVSSHSSVHPISDAEFRVMFDLAPVSLWLEDFSVLRTFFESLRSRGVTNLIEHFKQYPDEILYCAQLIKIERVNQRALEMLGMPDIESLRANLGQVFRDDMREQYMLELNALWCGHTSFTNQTVNYAPDGRRIDIQLHGRILPGYEQTWGRVLLALEDITARKKAEQHLAHLSTHDLMTQLRNRMFYEGELTRAEAEGPYPVTVISLDCNGLKPVNDVLGHAAGDALLHRAAQLLKQAVQDRGCAARIGGDEFAIILPGADEHDAAELAAHLTRLVDADNVQHRDAPISFSIGWAVCHQGERIDAAVRGADERMYAAKRAYYTMHERRRAEPKA